MQTISSEFPLNRWILIVAIMLAVVFVLPVYAETLSVHAARDERTFLESAWEYMCKILSEAMVGAVAGIVAGVVTVWRGARLGLKNFRVGMQHNKKAGIYERFLEALFAEKDALSSYMRMSHMQRRSKEYQKEQEQKEERATEEWGRAIAVATLYLSPESVETLHQCRKEISEAVNMGDPSYAMHAIDSVVKKVRQQAEADLGMK